jgi:acyl-CoA thioesterase-1
MQRLRVSFILAGLALGTIGCKTDSASKASSQIDAGTAPTQSMQALSPRQTPPPAKDTRPLIVCFGDSLTAGYGADEGQSYPDFLQKSLDEDGYHYRVVNAGVSGNTTKDGINRLSSVIAMKPSVVVVEFGGNDGLRGFKVQTTRDNLSEMVGRLKISGAKVVIAGITLPPDYGSDYVRQFTANYPELGRKYDVPVIPFLLKGVYGVDGMMQADNIHATDKGNELVATTVHNAVVPLLHK